MDPGRDPDPPTGSDAVDEDDRDRHDGGPAVDLDEAADSLTGLRHKAGDG
jgi:hypothetical protein